MAQRVALRVLGPPLPAGTRHCCFVNPFAGYGLVSVLRTLWTGATAVEPNLQAERMASWLVASRVSHISVSPIGLRKILDALPAAGVACDVRTIEIGGGVLPLPIYELAQTRLPAMVIATFGSTETGNVATAPYAAVAGRPDAAGYVLPGVTVQVVDADDRPLPAGTEGILRVRGLGVATGYRGDDAAAARVFRDGWVYPHDRAILDADGLLRITGRTDDVLVVDGVKLNPRTVEEALLGLADLREAAVFGVTNDEGHTVMCAAVVPNAQLDADVFHARCQERLRGRAPAFVMQLPELPRNAMGKVQRTELVRMALEARAAESRRSD
jgi:acyl-coenzyme A synthetase/AMP-(fatty) acid ligase